MASHSLGKRAVVIGGSVAGLITAGVLAKHFDEVTVIERDAYPEAPGFRKGVPQGSHAHGLSVMGYKTIVKMFPGLPAWLEQGGALMGLDAGRVLRAHQYGAYSIQAESGTRVTVASRALLDWALRQELATLPNIRYLTEHSAVGLAADSTNQTVTGVHVQPKAEGAESFLIESDFVVDASGRGSQLPKWLEQLGYSRPEESEVRVNVGYATRIFKRSTPDTTPPNLYLIVQPPPKGKRLAAIFPTEGQKWMVTLAGTCGDYPPTDEEGYRAFARTLPAPDASNIIEGEEPLGDIKQFRFPSNFRRHYEKLSRFPARLLVLGDAISSFNPIYGQGMTISAFEAASLQAMLAESNVSLDTIALGFFQRNTSLINEAWQLATGEDFRHPEVEGKRPFGLSMMHRFMESIAKTGHHDAKVHLTFLQVINLESPPSVLFSPEILWRVGRHALVGR